MRAQSSLQTEKVDHWENQRLWIKRMVKIWIALELGWYVGWGLYTVNDLL